MRWFQKVRSLLGLNTSVENDVLEDLSIKRKEADDLKDQIQKALNNFDEMSKGLELKIMACDKFIEKGEKYGEDNKKYLQQRLTIVTDAYLSEVAKMNDSLNKVNAEILAKESDIIAKAIQLTALLPSVDQEKIKSLITTWEQTGEINSEKVEHQSDAIYKAVEIISKSMDSETDGDDEEVEKSSDEGNKKVKKVMDEWKSGKLKSSSGDKVTNQKQAIAIALSEAGLSKAEVDEIQKAYDYNKKAYTYKEPKTYEGHYANMIVKRAFNVDNNSKTVEKILFLKRAKDKELAPGQYCLPGGHIDAGETIQQAAIRELKEEAGLVADYAYIEAKAKCDNGKWAFYLSSYIDSGDVVLLDGENDGYQWMTQDEWLEADLFFDLKDHLKALLIPEGERIEDIPTIKKAEEGGLSEDQYLEELSKALITVSDAVEEELINGEEIIKAKKAEIGEKRDWAGIEYVKTNHGWIKTKQTEEERKKKSDDFKHSTSDLVGHAENTSTDQLKKVVSSDEKKNHLRDAAKRELERRAEKKKDKGNGGTKKKPSSKSKEENTQKHHDKLHSLLDSGKFKSKNRVEQTKLIGDAQDHTRKVEKSLTQDFDDKEIDALDTYVSEKYKDINSYLRKGEKDNPELDKTISLIDSAISKNKLKEDIIVYRSLSGNQELVEDKAFQSTSIDPYTSNTFKTKEGKIYKLKIPAGTNYAYIGGGEKEMLLPRDLDLTKFIVK